MSLIGDGKGSTPDDPIVIDDEEESSLDAERERICMWRGTI
jgi:hypothetical protein